MRLYHFLLIIVAFILGFMSCKEFSNSTHKPEPIKQNNNSQVQYTLIPEPDKNDIIADVKQTVESETLSDFHSLSKVFYKNLQDCEPLNIVSSNGFEAYIIEGWIDNKCRFKHKQVGFVDTICNLPMDVARKYAEEGLDGIRQLDELKAQNKTGFVQASGFINEINNDKAYCRYEQYKHYKK